MITLTNHLSNENNIGQDTPFLETEDLDSENSSLSEELMETLEFGAEFHRFKEDIIIGNPNEDKEKFISRCLNEEFINKCPRKKGKKEGE